MSVPKGPDERRLLTAENCGEMEPAAGSTTLYIANRNLRPSSTRSLHDFCLWIDGTTSMPTWTMQQCWGHAMTRSPRSNPGENCSVSHTRVVALHSPQITNSTSAYNYPKKILLAFCHYLSHSSAISSITLSFSFTAAPIIRMSAP